MPVVEWQPAEEHINPGNQCMEILQGKDQLAKIAEECKAAVFQRCGAVIIFTVETGDKVIDQL